MSLNVKTRKVDGIVVIDMSGRLTIGEPVLLLRETLRVKVNDGVRQFVLNLGDVSYIDSSGLGELVSAYTTVRNKQGDVKLLNLTAKAKGVSRIIMITFLQSGAFFIAQLDFDKSAHRADTLAYFCQST